MYSWVHHLPLVNRVQINVMGGHEIKDDETGSLKIIHTIPRMFAKLQMLQMYINSNALMSFLSATLRAYVQTSWKPKKSLKVLLNRQNQIQTEHWKIYSFSREMCKVFFLRNAKLSHFQNVNNKFYTQSLTTAFWTSGSGVKTSVS